MAELHVLRVFIGPDGRGGNALGVFLDGASIAPVFDPSGLDPLVKALGPKVNELARNAGLKLVGGRVVARANTRRSVGGREPDRRRG